MLKILQQEATDFVKLKPIPTAEESYLMQNIFNVFDQMFYSNRSNSEDQFVEEGEAVNPDHKVVVDTKSPLDGQEEAIFNHDEKIVNQHLLNDQLNCLGEEIFNEDYKIPQFDGGIDDISSQSDEEIEGHLIPQRDGGNDDLILHQDGLDDEENSDLILKDVFAINCDLYEITTLLHFFRSCDLLWRKVPLHHLWKSDFKSVDLSCFYYYCLLMKSWIILK